MSIDVCLSRVCACEERGKVHVRHTYTVEREMCKGSEGTRVWWQRR